MRANTVQLKIEKYGCTVENDFFFLRVWHYDGFASKGLSQVAKWGSPRVLESELKAESAHIRTIIKARGLWYPNVNGKTFAVFRTDSKNHLVSLVTCIHKMYRGVHNGVSTVNKENKNQFLIFFGETQRKILVGKIIS